MTAVPIILVVTMAGYFAVTNHVPLAPLNSLSRDAPQLRSTLVGTVPAAFVVFALVESRGLALAAVWLWIWLLLQIRQWWVPHLFGATWIHRDFRWLTASGYQRTWKVLSPKTGRPVPDVQHLVLQLLTAASAVAVTGRAMGG